MFKLPSLKGLPLLKASLLFVVVAIAGFAGLYAVYAGNNAKKSLGAAEKASNSQIELVGDTPSDSTNNESQADDQTQSRPTPPSASSAPKSNSPCQSSSTSSSTATCVITVDTGPFNLYGVPGQQYGPYGSTLAGEVTIDCSAEDACTFNGIAFKKRTFNSDTYKPSDPAGQGTYSGIRIVMQKKSKVTFTVPLALQTSYTTPFCKGCAVSSFSHVFKLWTYAASSHSNHPTLTANYTSTKN